jgi:phosphoribosylanthranilate isomerase
MTWVKICGITNLEDALVAVEAGADALGFVFYEKSPRKIDPEAARKIVENVPSTLERVGVFVNMPMQDTFDTAEKAALSAVQIYGGESEISEAIRSIPTDTRRPKLIYAVNGNGFADQRGNMWLLNTAFVERLFALLVDCASQDQPGGTGNRFDWTKTRGAVQGLNRIRPTVVAGGLDPTNVTTAMTLLHPWGVDVSSGVEARPGKKDPDKVRAFIKAVRDHDKENSRN